MQTVRFPAAVVRASAFWERHSHSLQSLQPFPGAPPRTCVLGVDFGSRKTGVAILVPETGTCLELAMLRTNAHDVKCTHGRCERGC